MKTYLVGLAECRERGGKCLFAPGFSEFDIQLVPYFTGKEEVHSINGDGHFFNLKKDVARFLPD